MGTAEKAEGGQGGARKIVLAALAVLLALGGGVGVYVWRARHHAAPAAERVAAPYDLPVPTMMATLDSESGHATFVRVTAQIELASERDADSVRGRMPQIEDLFQTYLHDTRPDELAGSGIYRLREAMLAQLGNILAPVPVRDLFFTELLVQ
jgi:flagellar FliL protein